MKRVFCLVPGQWRFLVDALHERVNTSSLCAGQVSGDLYELDLDVEEQLARLRGVLAACDGGMLDLLKAVRVVEGEEIEARLRDVPDQLLLAYRIRALVTLAHQQEPISVLVTTCTYDVLGNTLVLVGKELGIPVIHVQHNCHAFVPEDAWFCKEAPGDLVLVPGERDVEWWRRCNPNVQVEVTGNPLWDRYATLQRVPHKRKTVVWAAESGANAAQTPAYWESRDVPAHAWIAFLEAVQHIEKPVEVVIKLRKGELYHMVDGWANSAYNALLEEPPQPMLTPHSLVFSQEEPYEVLPHVDVLVCQESNFGVEALHLGVPVVSIVRNGMSLLRICGDVEAVNPETKEIGAAIQCFLERPIGDATYEARYYNRGVDGNALERVVQRIVEVVNAH